jgi:hypothetical protein
VPEINVKSCLFDQTPGAKIIQDWNIYTEAKIKSAVQIEQWGKWIYHGLIIRPAKIVS